MSIVDYTYYSCCCCCCSIQSNSTNIFCYITHNNGINVHILDLEIASSLRRQRVFRDRLYLLDEYSDGEFIARYRISRYIFTELLNEIPSKLFQSTTRSHSIPPTTQLVVALQFLAIVHFIQ